MKRFVAVAMVVLFAAICVVCGYILGSEGVLAGSGLDKDPSVNKSINEVAETINRYFYKDVEQEVLTEGMLKGMAAMLGDPYSMYMTAEEYASYRDSSSGIYAGVGVLLGINDEGRAVVKEVYEGGSAKDVGIVAGDVFITVGGEDVTEVTDLADVSSLLKGEEGTSVDVTIERDGKQMNFTLERRQIKIKYVESRMIGDLGYIELKEFSGDCSKDFETAISSLKSQGAKGLIVDIRNNPGGYVKDAVSIADMLLPKGLIVYTEDKYGKRQEYASSDSYAEMPLVLLIDGGSASASEILAGALQDHEMADIVGVKSFGKGIVQKPYMINSTGGALMLTISTYYTPNGRSIHGDGIHPDYEVEMPQELLEDRTLINDDNDVQLKKAIEVMNGKVNQAAWLGYDAA